MIHEYCSSFLCWALNASELLWGQLGPSMHPKPRRPK